MSWDDRGPHVQDSIDRMLSSYRRIRLSSHNRLDVLQVWQFEHACLEVSDDSR